MHSQTAPLSPAERAMPPRRIVIPLLLLLLAPGLRLSCQTSTPPTQPDQTQDLGDIERRLDSLTSTLAETQRALQLSLQEIDRLRAEVESLRPAKETPLATANPPAPEPPTSTSVPSELNAVHEQQDILQAEIKQHDQTKVETSSRYRLRVTGLVLVNMYANAGVVDTPELPSLALFRAPGGAHGSTGGSLRQTVLGVAGTGPIVAGAQSSAFVNVDFFGGTNSNAFGYSVPSGYLRMRDALVSLDWSRSTLQAGYTTPLVSPLSPTSYAALAQPALASSGNLWTWSPQLRFEQRLPVAEDSAFALEAGLIDPGSPDYNSVQLTSPVEASRHPAFEGRISYRSGHLPHFAASADRPFVFGVGTYTASQFYSSDTRIRSWAVTGDWQVPIFARLDLTGEIYRGRALGGLGGGLYKDVLTGTDILTGRSRTAGVETAGGWAQLKLHLDRTAEANVAFGLDDAFSRSFGNLLISDDAASVAYAARNATVTGNLVFKPRSSLIFSPEYRHLVSWRYTGAPQVANIFTLSAGYQF